MSKNAITLATKVAIMEFLKKPDVLHVVEQGLCRYVGTWSDAEVASHFTATFGSTVTKANVAGVRHLLFGTIVSEPGSKVSDGILRAALERINVLEQDVRELKNSVQKLELAVKFNIKA